MINYFKLINRFWDEAPYLDGYKTDHAAVFFAVVDSINRNSWKDTEIEYDRIINKVRLGKKNYLAARHWLETNGFIRFKPGRGDYAKAKFGLGHAVLPKTASNTPPTPVPVPDAVPANTAPDTADDTAPQASAVLPETASNTAPDTATGTASNTHLIIGLPSTNNLLPITHQQQPDDSASLELGVDGAEKKEAGLDEHSGEVSGQKKEENPTPNPLPTADDVRAELVKSAGHRRYAFEQLKLAANDTQYLDLIDIFITQRECDSEEGKPAFKSMREARRHFMNWLGTRNLIQKPNGNTTSNGQGYKRTTSSLRPTAIGVPNYRGEGSHCDVDL